MRFPRLWIMVLLAGAPALAADFTGPESCRACHADAYNAWRESKHARALDALAPEQQKDARCISCHAPNLAEQKVSNVNCESCHGGGQYYASSYVMKDAELARLVGLQDQSEKKCRSCHDASSPSLRPFDFVEKLKLIDHWTVERAKRGTGARAEGKSR
jgi:formate-dependent nitrite reductase cytochrome c552 subunit